MWVKWVYSVIPVCVCICFPYGRLLGYSFFNVHCRHSPPFRQRAQFTAAVHATIAVEIWYVFSLLQKKKTEQSAEGVRPASSSAPTQQQQRCNQKKKFEIKFNIAIKSEKNNITNSEIKREYKMVMRAAGRWVPRPNGRDTVERFSKATVTTWCLTGGRPSIESLENERAKKNRMKQSERVSEGETLHMTTTYVMPAREWTACHIIYATRCREMDGHNPSGAKCNTHTCQIETLSIFEISFRNIMANRNFSLILLSYGIPS